MQTATSNEI